MTCKVFACYYKINACTRHISSKVVHYFTKKVVSCVQISAYFLCESGRFTNRESLIVWVWWGEHPKLTISCIRKGKSTCMLTAHTRLLIPRREPPSCEAPRQRTIYYFIFYLKQFEFLTMALSPGAPVCYFINFGAEIFF